MESEQRQIEEALLEQGMKAMGEWRALSEKNQKAMIASLRDSRELCDGDYEPSQK